MMKDPLPLVVSFTGNLNVTGNVNIEGNTTMQDDLTFNDASIENVHTPRWVKRIQGNYRYVG